MVTINPNIVPTSQPDDSFKLTLLQNHSNLHNGQHQVLWSIFGAFWTANAVLLVSIFTSNESWEKSIVGIIISIVGLSISGVWAFIQKRAIKRLEIYENAIKVIEINLNLPLDLCAFYNPAPQQKIKGRTIMIWFSYVSVISWLFSLLGYLFT